MIVVAWLAVEVPKYMWCAGLISHSWRHPSTQPFVPRRPRTLWFIGARAEDFLILSPPDWINPRSRLSPVSQCQFSGFSKRGIAGSAQFHLAATANHCQSQRPMTMARNAFNQPNAAAVAMPARWRRSNRQGAQYFHSSNLDASNISSAFNHAAFPQALREVRVSFYSALDSWPTCMNSRNAETAVFCSTLVAHARPTSIVGMRSSREMTSTRRPSRDQGR